MDDSFIENIGVEPFEFQLANGNNVKIVFASFWEDISETNLPLGAKPEKYHALRIYSNEDTYPRRMARQYEFRACNEFDPAVIPKLWQWFESSVENRKFFDYDWLDDFIEDLAQQIEDLLPEDAFEHYEHLPEINFPEAFDKVDDSVFNDQNDDRQNS